MTRTDNSSIVGGLWHEWSALVLDSGSRTYWGSLLLALCIVWMVQGWRRLRGQHRGTRTLKARLHQWFGRSARVDYLLVAIKPLWFIWWAIPWALTAHGLAANMVVKADHAFGRPEVGPWDAWAVTALYTVVLFVAWDLSRYLLHRAMHRFELLWQLHQVHHSAQTLTPLTLYRVHPIESALYQVRGVVVTAGVTAIFFYVFRGQASEFQLLGVNGLGFFFSAVGGNLRHSHTFWSWGSRIERWFISPAQHQFHHALGPGHGRVNYGTWLALWDRLDGSLRVAGDHEPEAFGLSPSETNHDPHSLISILFAPLLAAFRRVRRPARERLTRLTSLSCVVVGLLAPSLATGQAPPSPIPDPQDPPLGQPEEEPPQAPPNAGEESPAGESSPSSDDGVEGADAAPSELLGEQGQGEEEAEGEGEGEADLDMSDLYDEPPSDAASSSEPRGTSAPVDPAGSAGPSDLVAPTVSIIGRPEDLRRVVGSAHVVDEEALERDENDDIQRVLRSVPGVYVREEDGFGLRPNIGLRGVDPNRSSKITLMEDGVLLGPAPYAAPAAYYFPLTTRMVGVEVFKGPAAIRHGPNTIGGAINLRTRDIPREADGGLDLALGARGYGKAHGYWGRSWKHFGVLIEGARLQSNGFKQLDGGGDTGFGKNEGMIKLRANTSPAGRIYHQFDAKAGFSTERSNETYLGLTDADFKATPYRRYAASQLGRMQWWRSQAQLRYLLAFGDLVEFQSTAYRHDFSRAWRKFNAFAGGPSNAAILADNGGGQAAIYLGILRGEEDSAGSDQSLLIGTNNRRYVSQGVQNVLTISPRTRYVDQRIEIGARFHHDTIRRVHTEDGYSMLSAVLVPDGTPNETTTSNRGTAFTGAFHVQDEIRIVDRLTLSPGARVEVINTQFEDNLADTRSDSFAAVFIPGAGAHVQATSWMGVLAGVHSGFSPVAPGQPDEVRPERSVNYEGGFRFGGEPLHGFTAEAIGFYNDYSNLTGECTFAQGCDDENIGDQYNAGRVGVAGAELAAGYERSLERGGWLDADASYTYTWSRFQTSFVSGSPQFGEVEVGDALPYLPQHVASLKLAGGMKRWAVSSTLQYNGEMRDLPGQGEIPEESKIPRFLTLDLGARVWVTPRASVYINVMNVTNSKYMVSRRPFGVRPGRPMSGFIGFKYDFGA